MSLGVDNSFLACRLCGNDNENMLLDLASDKLKFAADYRNMVYVMTSIQIDPEDRLFTLVCRGCIKRVLDGYEFREKARERNSYLLQKRDGLCKTVDVQSATLPSVESGASSAHRLRIASPPLSGTHEKASGQPTNASSTSASDAAESLPVEVANSNMMSFDIEPIVIFSSLDSSIDLTTQVEPLLKISHATSTQLPEILRPTYKKRNGRATCRYCYKTFKSIYYRRLHQQQHTTCKYCKLILGNLEERKQHEIGCVQITDKVWVTLTRLETDPKLRSEISYEVLEDLEDARKRYSSLMNTVKLEPIDKEIPNVDYFDTMLIAGVIKEQETIEITEPAIQQQLSTEFMSVVDFAPPEFRNANIHKEDLFIHSLLCRLRIEKSFRSTQCEMFDVGVIQQDGHAFGLIHIGSVLEDFARVPVVFRKVAKNVSATYRIYSAPKPVVHFHSFAHLAPISLKPRRPRPLPISIEGVNKTKSKRKPTLKPSPETMLAIMQWEQTKPRKAKIAQQKTIQMESPVLPHTYPTYIESDSSDVEIVDTNHATPDVIVCDDENSNNDLIIDISAESDSETNGSSVTPQNTLAIPSTSTQGLAFVQSSEKATKTPEDIQDLLDKHIIPNIELELNDIFK